MKVFISWSGAASHAVAMLLRDELPVVINAVKPFVSSEDIAKGSPWFQNVAGELENSAFGVVCLTEANLNNKWILFEAGALAGKLSKKRVAPLLLDLSPEEVEPPLGQLQLTSLGNKEDFFKLLLVINNELGEHALQESTLKRSFEIWWEHFNKKVQESLRALPKTTSKTVERSDSEILREILSLTRSIVSNETQHPAITFYEQVKRAQNPRLAAFAKSPVRYKREFDPKTGGVKYIPSSYEEGDIPIGESPTAEDGEPLI
jgi:hypothetical protein